MKAKTGDYVLLLVMLVALALGAAALYFRISGDLTVCREYYPEMGRLECYMSSKTVRTPGDRR
jgi:hypothetical protein